MLLWLDDDREPPPGWRWARTAREALSLLRTGRVRYASLDCDLQDGRENGVWLVMQMIRYRAWPEFKPGVHSSNWQDGAKMLYLIRRHGPYDEYATMNGLTRRPRRSAA